ncbi:MAG: HD domain-containing protein [Ktedonobacteraceae bacterium]
MKVDISLVEWAAENAESLLAPLGNRWLHVQGVVERARWIGEIFDAEDKALLIASAYMHDIGYAPSLKKTGFHPLDGACYVRSLGYERLGSLVAYHSSAYFEAELRGFEKALSEFTCERSVVADALTYCDMTTNSVGLPVTLKERLADIFSRYGDADVVTQALHKALPYISLSVGRTQLRLRKHGLMVESQVITG